MCTIYLVEFPHFEENEVGVVCIGEALHEVGDGVELGGQERGLLGKDREQIQAIVAILGNGFRVCLELILQHPPVS